MLLLLGIFSIFIHNGLSSNILGVFMYPSLADQIIFQKIYRELSQRGHQVTVLTPNPLNNPKLTNLTEISLKFAYDILEKNKPDDVYFKNLNPYQYTRKFHNLLDMIAEKELSSPQFQALLSDHSKKFDLILIDVIHPVMFALSHRFQSPIISISSKAVSNDIYDSVGNPNHPILYPDPILNLRPGILTMGEKFKSICFFLWSKYQHHQVFVPRAHKMAMKYFGEDVPYLGDLERNVSMFFININFILNIPRANVPAIVEMGPLIDELEAKPLPNQLKKLLDEAKNGVIFVNLGSNLRNFSFGGKLRNNFMTAFRELPYTILFKGESPDLFDKPSNVIVRKSLKQRDVLAHPNVKLFITEGDQRSVEEAIAEEVPFIGIPFNGYQPGNVRRAVELKIAERIDPDQLTTTRLKNTINKVLNTESYYESMINIKDILFDKPMTGLDSVVWWAEYVIRHDGARHLRCASVDMPWYQYLLLDVLLFLIFCISLVVCIIWKALVKVVEYSKLVVMGRQKSQEDKKLKRN